MDQHDIIPDAAMEGKFSTMEEQLQQERKIFVEKVNEIMDQCQRIVWNLCKQYENVLYRKSGTEEELIFGENTDGEDKTESEQPDNPPVPLMPETPKVISFSGFQWTVNPTSSKWNSDNAFVDEHGKLHLRLSKEDDGWQGALLTSVSKFGFGRYQFHVDARLDKLDPNVTFAMYSQPEHSPDSVAIKFAKWGYGDAEQVSYGMSNRFVNEPFLRTATSVGHRFKLNGPNTTHSFYRKRNSVLFRSQHGHENNNNRYEIFNWNCELPKEIDQQDEYAPVTLGLSLYDGRPPTDGQEVEIVITSFIFHP
ncbi:uncharacterized protein LOC129599143 [Paramacrobiotus metropolitanus]|uniref:uncharacterized protein LOC129599143 n=1 Tax=Paramacrobiotus metropolitanus TaxID=2943436 RepID=UPI0024456C25|nr:uncharacterized protein LOC129599143 [Paramacrobiotus metropolitanus]XP_055353259.1 uncharacterized protein LOC129599143 [Paramacrobiotus metropolitanus]